MLILFALIFIQAMINVVGALAPDIAFDALWYHLTLPKLYLLSHTIIHIPGYLIPYSDMPKLAELLYTGALAFGDERLVNLLQFGAGVLCCFIIYRIARRHMSQKFSLLAVVVFYSNIAVAWESTTAYIDLIRTFFELLALWSFLEWFQTKYKKWLYLAAIFTGFAMTTKLLGIGSLSIFLLLIWFSQKGESIVSRVTSVFIFSVLVLLIPSPWFIFSFFHTGNPIYPFFTSLYPTEMSTNILNPLLFLQIIVQLFTAAADPISPIYLVTLPLLVWKYKTFPKELKLLSWYAMLALFVWYISPQTGGGRFIIPYLPVFSIVVSYVVFSFDKHKDSLIIQYTKVLIMTILLIAISTIIYRGAASIRYLPVVFGRQTKNEFLTKNLNFSFGDFYDTDGYFEKHLSPKDNVLLYGFHNVYYVDFPFIDASWVKKGDKFNYIAVQNGILPSRFTSWQKIYANVTTHVIVYSDGGKVWRY